MTPEPIRREERERWSRIVADRQGTGLIHEHVGRLLAALDAGEALADRIAYAHKWLETVQQKATGYFGLDHELGAHPDCSLCAALAGWRARVKGS